MGAVAAGAPALRMLLLAAAVLPAWSLAESPPPRARDLGIPFDGVPGALNAITDVRGVTVGHATILRDLPQDRAARTGVTAILPRGRDSLMQPVFGAWFALNGNGEMTGTAWLDESGLLEGPVMITNTHSVGTVHEATIRWRIAQGAADAGGYFWSLPVVAETWDGYLNDINGFHVTAESAYAALDAAKPGPVAEGSVGGGTGMVCHEFKCGIGTSSRIADTGGGRFVVGVLVQANYGLRDQLRIAGVPVGRHLTEDRIYAALPPSGAETGSIIVVVATDAPLLPQQLRRLAKRAALGLARLGSIAGNGSGDLFIAFSTANEGAGIAASNAPLRMLANDDMDPLFGATVDATEEAIVNALIAGRDMTGDLGHTVRGIDHERLLELLDTYNRID